MESSSESSDVFSQSVADLDPEAEVSTGEEEGLILRSGQVVHRPPRPIRGVKNRRRGGRRDENVTETEGEEPVVTEAEGEEVTGATGGVHFSGTGDQWN